MRKKADVVCNIAMYLIIMLIIFILAKIFPKFMMASKGLQFSEYDMYRSYMSIGIICIGISLEYRNIIKGFKYGFKVNIIYLILSFLLAAILFIPYELGMKITGIGLEFYILQYGIFRSVIGIIAGITFIRAISKNDYYSL